jgi:hypothetical protein
MVGILPKEMGDHIYSTGYPSNFVMCFVIEKANDKLILEKLLDGILKEANIVEAKAIAKAKELAEVKAASNAITAGAAEVKAAFKAYIAAEAKASAEAARSARSAESARSAWSVWSKKINLQFFPLSDNMLFNFYKFLNNILSLNSYTYRKEK